MKKLIILFVFAVLSACSSSEDPQKYTSLAGEWKFSSTGVSGKFKVEKTYSSFEVKSGYFVLNSHKYTIDVATPFNGAAGTNEVTVTLISGQGNISFVNTTYSEDFAEITGTGFFYNDNGQYGEVNEEVVIKR